jgi:putative membrane protein
MLFSKQEIPLNETAKPILQTSKLTNRGEAKPFLKTALAWNGTVTPRVIPRVFVTVLYSTIVVIVAKQFPVFAITMTPFEYSGAVLGLLLVLRVNAGIDRWWEARKIWGSIVNQSRNLALIGYGYSEAKKDVGKVFLRWVAAWPHVIRESLRRENSLVEPALLLGSEETELIRKANHMPTYVASKIILILSELRDRGLDPFSFQQAEKERALLIDAVGACERIRNTPMPFALAVKIRRFILLFLLLLPIALAEKVGLLTPLIVSLVAYPMFSLDEIGAELQNPFSPRNISHLPLNEICRTIEANVMSLEQNSPNSNPTTHILDNKTSLTN